MLGEDAPLNSGCWDGQDLNKLNSDAANCVDSKQAVDTNDLQKPRHHQRGGLDPIDTSSHAELPYVSMKLSFVMSPQHAFSHSVSRTYGTNSPANIKRRFMIARIGSGEFTSAGARYLAFNQNAKKTAAMRFKVLGVKATEDHNCSDFEDDASGDEEEDDEEYDDYYDEVDDGYGSGDGKKMNGRPRCQASFLSMLGSRLAKVIEPLFTFLKSKLEGVISEDEMKTLDNLYSINDIALFKKLLEMQYVGLDDFEVDDEILNMVIAQREETAQRNKQSTSHRAIGRAIVAACLRNLLEGRMLAEQQVCLIYDFFIGGDEDVIAVFEVFSQNKDFDDLAENLRVVCNFHEEWTEEDNQIQPGSSGALQQAAPQRDSWPRGFERLVDKTKATKNLESLRSQLPYQAYLSLHQEVESDDTFVVDLLNHASSFERNESLYNLYKKFLINVAKEKPDEALRFGHGIFSRHPSLIALLEGLIGKEKTEELMEDKTLTSPEKVIDKLSSLTSAVPSA